MRKRILNRMGGFRPLHMALIGALFSAPVRFNAENFSTSPFFAALIPTTKRYEHPMSAHWFAHPHRSALLIKN
jgi:hypothetical protein